MRRPRNPTSGENRHDNRLGDCAWVAGVVELCARPRLREADAFFRGWSERISPPGLLTLVLSQVTTWIFARSLLSAAILGYNYGIAGALAYAAYYLSFFTGAAIVDHIRFRHGEDSI